MTAGDPSVTPLAPPLYAPMTRPAVARPSDARLITAMRFRYDMFAVVGPFVPRLERPAAPVEIWHRGVVACSALGGLALFWPWWPSSAAGASGRDDRQVLVH